MPGLRVTVVVQTAVDCTHFGRPLPALTVFKRQQLLQRPMHVVGQERYLLMELVEGVARYSPSPDPSSTPSCSSDATGSGNCSPQAGQRQLPSPRSASGGLFL